MLVVDGADGALRRASSPSTASRVSVDEGELVALVGPNGAGKTTLLNTVAGLVRPAGGRVLLDGVDVTGAEPARLVRAGLALVPERRRIFRDLTVGENLQLAGVTAGAGERRRRLDEARERFPVLANRWSTAAGYLSGGEAQQLAVARALMSKPRIVLLDEPTLGLAPIMVDVVFDLLVELRAGGTHRVRRRAERPPGAGDRRPRLRAAHRPHRRRGPRPGARPPTRTCSGTSSAGPARERARPEPRRRDRARQHVRPAGARHLADLRRDAPRQLRPRRADHGRRLRRLLPLDARARVVGAGAGDRARRRRRLGGHRARRLPLGAQRQPVHDAADVVRPRAAVARLLGGVRVAEQEVVRRAGVGVRHGRGRRHPPRGDGPRDDRRRRPSCWR